MQTKALDIAVSYLPLILISSMTNEGRTRSKADDFEGVFSVLNKLFTSGWSDPCGLVRFYKLLEKFDTSSVITKKNPISMSNSFLRRVWCEFSNKKLSICCWASKNHQINIKRSSFRLLSHNMSYIMWQNDQFTATQITRVFISMRGENFAIMGLNFKLWLWKWCENLLSFCFIEKKLIEWPRGN